MSYKQPKNSSEERLLVHNNFLCSFIFGIDCTEIWCHPNEYHQCIYEYWFSCVQIFTHLIYVLFRWFMEKFFLNFVPTESSFFFKEMYCFVENNWPKLFLGSYVPVIFEPKAIAVQPVETLTMSHQWEYSYCFVLQFSASVVCPMLSNDLFIWNSRLH